MEIITATEVHMPEIIELWKELMDFHKNINAYWTRREDGHITYEKMLREMLEREVAIILVAVDNGRVVGYSCALVRKPSLTRKQDRYGDIPDIMVTAEYRRRGIGERMLKMILKWFESKNIDRIELNIAAQNSISTSFWEKQGFKDYEHRLYLDLGR
jgi:ribosomal protein S18 acetylase RimI-like enzyme